MRIQLHSPVHDRFSDWQLDELFRFRNRYFNDIRGWCLPVDQGREIDRFDRDPALYAAAIEEDGSMVGCFRLLPTETPHLLDSYFPQLMGDTPVLRGPAIWEISRLAVLPQSASGAETMRITARLLKSLFEMCDDLDIAQLTCVTDTQFERLLRLGGFACHRFGGIHRVGVEDCVAGYLTVNRHNHDAAETMVARWDRQRPVVPAPIRAPAHAQPLWTAQPALAG